MFYPKPPPSTIPGLCELAGDFFCHRALYSGGQFGGCTGCDADHGVEDPAAGLRRHPTQVRAPSKITSARYSAKRSTRRRRLQVVVVLGHQRVQRVRDRCIPLTISSAGCTVQRQGGEQNSAGELVCVFGRTPTQLGAEGPADQPGFGRRAPRTNFRIASKSFFSAKPPVKTPSLVPRIEGGTADVASACRCSTVPAGGRDLLVHVRVHVAAVGGVRGWSPKCRLDFAFPGKGEFTDEALAVRSGDSKFSRRAEAQYVLSGGNSGGAEDVAGGIGIPARG